MFFGKCKETDHTVGVSMRKDSQFYGAKSGSTLQFLSHIDSDNFPFFFPHSIHKTSISLDSFAWWLLLTDSREPWDEKNHHESPTSQIQAQKMGLAIFGVSQGVTLKPHRFFFGILVPIKFPIWGDSTIQMYGNFFSIVQEVWVVKKKWRPVFWEAFQWEHVSGSHLSWTSFLPGRIR